jgi:hypothetical protein
MVKTLVYSVPLAITRVVSIRRLLYSFQFEEKVEQYDEHIALYVNNTFARTRFRYPHYMYEENWLFMRNLDDEEQQEAVLKYGDPDNYYND